MVAYLAWAGEQPIEAFLDSTYTWRARLPVPADAALRMPTQNDWSETPSFAADGLSAAAVAVAERWQEATARAAVLRAEAEAHKAAREAERAAVAARRQARLQRVVREQMDDNAKARWDLGVLADEEILDVMRPRLFAPLDEFPRFRKIHASDLDHADECDGEWSLDCETPRAPALSADQYAVYARIEEAASPLREAGTLTVSPVCHRCTCERCEAVLERCAARVDVVARIRPRPGRHGLRPPAPAAARVGNANRAGRAPIS